MSKDCDFLLLLTNKIDWGDCVAQYKSGIRTKLNIYYACEKLFYEKGYTDTTILDINNLANSTNSSFYHHYQNKLELGTLIYSAFGRRNTRTADLFGNRIDPIQKFCLSLKTFWYLFFVDENIRKFAKELNNKEAIHLKEHKNTLDLCRQFSQNEISDNEMELIKTANLGLSLQLLSDIYNKVDRFNYIEVSDYYLKTLFRLFYIDADTINDILTKTKELFSKCIITNEGFYVTCHLK